MVTTQLASRSPLPQKDEETSMKRSIIVLLHLVVLGVAASSCVGGSVAAEHTFRAGVPSDASRTYGGKPMPDNLCVKAAAEAHGWALWRQRWCWCSVGSCVFAVAAWRRFRSLGSWLTCIGCVAFALRSLHLWYYPF